MLLFPNVFYCLLLDFIKATRQQFYGMLTGSVMKSLLLTYQPFPNGNQLYCISVFLIYTFLFAIIPLNDKFCDFLIPLNDMIGIQEPFQQECQEVREGIELAIETNILISQFETIFYIWVFSCFSASCSVRLWHCRQI